MVEPLEEGPTPLGRALAAETARRELTQGQAARLCGTSQQTFGKWMRGEIRQPGDEHLKLIADYLRLTLDEVRALRRQAAPSRDPLSRQSSLRRIAALEREVRELRSETERLVSRLEQIARRLDGDSPNE